MIRAGLCGVLLSSQSNSFAGNARERAPVSWAITSRTDPIHLAYQICLNYMYCTYSNVVKGHIVNVYNSFHFLPHSSEATQAPLVFDLGDRAVFGTCSTSNGGQCRSHVRAMLHDTRSNDTHSIFWCRPVVRVKDSSKTILRVKTRAREVGIASTRKQ